MAIPRKETRKDFQLHSLSGSANQNNMEILCHPSEWKKIIRCLVTQNVGEDEGKQELPHHR